MLQTWTISYSTGFKSEEAVIHYYQDKSESISSLCLSFSAGHCCGSWDGFTTD